MDAPQALVFHAILQAMSLSVFTVLYSGPYNDGVCRRGE